MRERKELLVLIPARNEEENIGAVLEEVARRRIQDLADIVVINDASEDGTARVVRKWPVHMLTNLERMGYGTSLQIGYRYALEKGYRYIIQMDGDGQHDVCNIPVIYNKLKEADEDGRYPDIVLGARFRKDSSDFPVSWPKKVVYSLFRGMIHLVTGAKISDPTTGLQGLSRKAFLYYSKYNHFDDKYPDANMLVLMLMIRFKVVEIPAVMHARTAGKSMHSGLKPFWYMLRVMYSTVIIIFRVKFLKMDVEVGLRSADKI